MLLRYLERHWEEILGSPPPAGLQIACITSCPYYYGNDVVPIFVDGGKFPRYVMKISRNRAYGSKLEREFAALEWFSKVPDLGDLVPEPCHLGALEGRRFFIQGGIEGQDLAQRVRERGLDSINRRLLEQSVDLLARVNSCPRREATVPALSLDERLALSNGERQRLEKASQELSPLVGRYFLHGDFWPLNLLIRSRRIVGILDWEFSQPAASLPLDIVWCLVNLGYSLGLHHNPQNSIEETFRWAFFESGSQSSFISLCAGRYFETMGLEASLFPTLLEVGLAQMAQRELREYGHAAKMDAICLALLRYLLGHADQLAVFAK